MTITQDIIERVKEETDIVSLISETVDLKKNGAIWKGLCPFHNEKTPSFTVTPAKGIYYCFGCSATGDSIKWLQEQGGTFPQAVKELAGKLNIHIEAEPEHTLRPPKSKLLTRRGSFEEPKPEPADIQAVAKESCSRLLEGKLPSSFIQMITRRAWSEQTIATLARANQLGINEKGKMLYIYPEGIKVRGDYDSSRGDRWLIGKAKDNIWRANELEHDLVQDVFVFEGETDLISFMSHRPEGITDAYVALPGSSNAKISPVLAYRMGKERRVFLMFDNDDAGRKAAGKMGGILKKEANCKVYQIDWSEDAPNDIGDLPQESLKYMRYRKM